MPKDPGIPSDAFGRAAPSKNLPFPPTAHLTAVELLAFLPHSLKSTSVIHRLITNGHSRRSISAIINAHRTLTIPHWTPNSAGQGMIKTMRDAGYKDWTVTTHGSIFGEEGKENWDPLWLGVGGLKTPSEENGDGKAGDELVEFKNLASDVKMLPKGDDGLNLTRMVEYAVANPEEVWMYPIDWDVLLEKLGGTKLVGVEHSDGEVAKRWDKMGDGSVKPKPKPQVKRAPGEPHRPRGRPRKSAEPRKIETLGELGGDATADAVRPHQLGGAVLFGEPGDDEPAGVTKPAVFEPPPLFPVSEPKEESLFPPESSREDSPDEEYIRSKPKLLEPPDQIIFPSIDDIAQAFLDEGSLEQPEPFGAYAFKGPRKSAPFRPLHCISSPTPNDISGWAENLRWAAEQKIMFGTEGWDERPEHMDLIWQERINSEWVSDKWLENYAAKQHNKKMREGEQRGIIKIEKKEWEGEVDYLRGGWCSCSACYDCCHLMGSRARFEVVDETPGTILKVFIL